MPLWGSSKAQKIDDVTDRSEDQILLIDQVVLNDSVTSFNSDPVTCGAFRHFCLYLRVKSSGTPTTVQFIPEFANQVEGPWHTYKQGLFASLFYEDQDTVTEVQECFSGDVAGRVMRVRAVGTGTGATDTFTVSAVVEFYS